MLSTHACKRLQQRAIPPMVIDLLFDYGKLEYDHRGAGVYFFDSVGKKHARGMMRQSGLTQIDHCLNVYIVESSSGNVVTVGHRVKRINRN